MRTFTERRSLEFKPCTLGSFTSITGFSKAFTTKAFFDISANSGHCLSQFVTVNARLMASFRLRSRPTSSAFSP